MAISAVNSINFNRVAFKGAETASKTTETNQDSFFEDNKEVIIGLSAIGAATLGAIALYRSGKLGSKAAQLPITDRHYDGTVGLRNIQRMQNAVNTAKINEQIAEFGADGSRHIARMNDSNYTDPDKLAKMFDKPANSRADVLGWKRASEAKAQGLEIDPEDFVSYAKVEGLSLSELVK